MFLTVFFSVVAFIIVCTFYSLYVSLIKKKNKVKEALSSIDVQLKKRYDLIPNILTIASKFMEHEKELITEVTKLRTEAIDATKLNDKFSIGKEISKKMSEIMVAVENYPTLKSDVTMLHAMQTYNEVEEYISAARRFYNSAALELNNAVEIFPSSFVAQMINIQRVDFIEIKEEERKAINASEYLK